MPFRTRPAKTLGEIISEWDEIAPIRIAQILSGNDPTFTHISAPSILSLVQNERKGSLLDAGCGVGILTDMLSKEFKTVVGVDPSRKSIEIAGEYFGENASFIPQTLESYAYNQKTRFDVIVANMVLMDVIDLDAFLTSCSKILKRGGAFVFTVTHPCFWADYYGYENEPWFEYKQEIIVESPFRISNQQDCRLVSTHFHRPLERYVSAFSSAGLLLEVLAEPTPTSMVEQLYPKPWRFPRYLIGKCRLPKRFVTKTS